jgi:protein TonB
LKESKRGQYSLVLSVMLHIVILFGVGYLFHSKESVSAAMIEFEFISIEQAASSPPAPRTQTPPSTPITPARPIVTPRPVVDRTAVETTSSEITETADVADNVSAPVSEPVNSTISGNTSGETGTSSSSGTLRPPQLLHKVEPTYPETARRQSIEGKVVIRIEVSTNGSVSNATIEQSSGQQILDNSALAAVRRWRFVPARDANNAPMLSVTTVPIIFRLN